ncbi:MAG TPA: TVP38/TMEM64 family protein [Clostridiaceae bacterium]|nr:TVP38/TMEM64 family protein [Clostridiaceae bacterium]
MKNLSNKKLIAFIGVIILIFILNQFFGWSEYFKGVYNMAFLKNMVDENIVMAGTIYVLLTIVGCVVLALPGATFAIFAGLVFGPVLGTLLCSLATTIGAAGAFLVGRFFLKESIKPKIAKNKYLKKLLFDETGENELFVLMITRLLPIFPYNLQNFAYGITDIRFWNFVMYSCIFMLPGTAMYTVGTAGIADRENRTLYIFIALAMAALVFGLGHFLKKRHILKDSEELKVKKYGL